jgi:hypothetical protein
MSLSPKARLLLTIGIPFGAHLVHFLWGKATLLGLDGKKVAPLSNEKCITIPGESEEQGEQGGGIAHTFGLPTELQGCEDAYVLEDSGLAYL